MRLTKILNKKYTSAQARLNLARWCNEVENFGENEFARVLETFENHNETIINYFGILQRQGKGFQNAVQKRWRYQVLYVQTCNTICLIRRGANQKYPLIRIMHKAQKNKPLTRGDTAVNKAISRMRYAVERTFGSMRR